VKIAIIGGSGFIGNALVNRLSQSHEVRASFFSGKKQEKETLRTTLFTYVDISDQTSILRFIEEQDVVINCSGALALWNTSRKELFATNVEGTKNVVSALKKAKSPYYVHFSTCGVSGPSTTLFINNEDKRINPADYYAKTKLLGENAVHKYFLEGGNGVILRPTWSYGIGDKHKLQLFNAIQREKFALINGGKARFQPIYIDDICDAVEKVIAKKPKAATYLLAGPEIVTQANAFEIISGSLNQQNYQCTRLGYGFALIVAYFLTFFSKTFKIGVPFNLTRFRLFAMNWLYDTSRIKKDVGFTSAIPFQEGISRTIQWYKEKELL